MSAATSPERKKSMEEAFALLAVLRENLQHQQLPTEEDEAAAEEEANKIEQEHEKEVAAENRNGTQEAGGTQNGDAAANGSQNEPAKRVDSAPPLSARFANPKETPRISSLKDQVEQLRRDKKALLAQLDAVEEKLRENQNEAPHHVQPLVAFMEPPDGNAAPLTQNLPPKFIGLQNRVSEAATNAAQNVPGASPQAGATVMVWESSDVKFTDEKVMNNLSRRYQLTLVGIPLHNSDTGSDVVGAGPKVTKAAASSTGGAASRTTSPAVTVVKRNVSPTASKRLVNPSPSVSVASRKVTPSRTTPGAVGSSTTGSRITPSRSGSTAASGPLAKDVARKPTPTTTSRVTPLRRASPSASVGAKGPATAAGKKPADPKPVLRFTPAQSQEGTPERKPQTATTSSPAARSTPVRKATSPSSTKTRTTSPAKTTTGATTTARTAASTKPATAARTTAGASEKENKPPADEDMNLGGTVPPSLSISAALAQFKGIAPDETPRVPGDGKGPMPAKTATASGVTVKTTGGHGATSPARKATGPSGVGAATRPATSGSRLASTTGAATRPGTATSSTTRPKAVQGTAVRSTLAGSKSTTLGARK